MLVSGMHRISLVRHFRPNIPAVTVGAPGKLRVNRGKFRSQSSAAPEHA
jgi:hypothetical protein